MDHNADPNFIIIIIVAVVLACGLCGCGKKMALEPVSSGADTTQVSK